MTGGFASTTSRCENCGEPSVEIGPLESLCPGCKVDCERCSDATDPDRLEDGICPECRRLAELAEA